MSHHAFFKRFPYHIDSMGCHKTILPKKDGDEKKVVTMSSCMAVGSLNFGMPQKIQKR